MLCAVFRLARYNIQSDDAVPTKIFFGMFGNTSGHAPMSAAVSNSDFNLLATAFDSTSS